MDNVYKNNEAKKLYQGLNSIRKGFKPQTLLIRDKEGKKVSNTGACEYGNELSGSIKCGEFLD